MKGFKQLVFLVSVIPALLIMTAHGADYALKSGTTDWTLTSSYDPEPAQVPGSADTVTLPANETFEVDAASPSFTTLSGFRRLVPSSGSRLVITVGEGEKTLGCAFNNNGEAGKGASTGEFVKKGAGRLNLGSTGAIRASNGDAYDYCSGMTLAEGTLALVAEPAAFTGYSVYGSLVTSNGTTLVVTPGPSRSSTIMTRVEVIRFAGLVTNESSTVQRFLSVSSRTGYLSEVSGVLGGNIRFWNTGSVNFTGSDSTFTGGVTQQGWNEIDPYSTIGVAGILTFGNMADAASSAGVSSMLVNYGPGCFRYLGTGASSTDKDFCVYGTLGIDGGAYGGLTLRGHLRNDTDKASNFGQKSLILSGSNLTERCVYSGTVFGSTSAGTDPNYSFYVIKRGIGTWLFSGKKVGWNEGLNGGFAIEEGTFQFNSLAARGEDCALGTALALTDGQQGVWTPEHWVDYAVTLGSAAPAAPAVFEYVGTDAASCTTRPIVLAGVGGTLRADSGTLSYAGITARDANASPVLTLAGTSTAGNEVREITNRTSAAGAKVGLAKTGSGTWKVGGNFTFGGDVAVQEGVLSIDVPQKPKTPVYRDYKWFRLSFAELAGGNGRQVNIRQIALFDKDGVRQNVGLTVPAGTFDSAANTVRTVEPGAGEAVYDASMSGMTLTGGTAETLQTCFNGLYSGYTAYNGTFSAAPNKDNPSSWFKVVMRLADNANPITHFDVQGFNNTYVLVPTRMRMEGSVDGRHWTELYSNVTNDMPHTATMAGYNCWISDGVGGSASNRPLGTGFTLSVSGETSAYEDPFSYFRFSVAEIDRNDNYLCIRGIYLFDKDGLRQNTDLVLPAGIDPQSGVARTVTATAIGPGEVNYDPAAAGYKVKPYTWVSGTLCDLPTAFNGLSTDNGVYYMQWLNSSGTVLTPKPSDPKTWIPIVMHLRTTASPITHFDIKALNQYSSASSTRVPTRVKLEGSRDGKIWTEVWSNVDGEPFDVTAMTGYNRWVSDGSSSSRPLATAATKTSRQYPPFVTYDQNLDGFVSVAVGATLEATETLEIEKLRIDADGAGTLSGFAFAASGVLDILNAKKDGRALPGTYENCTGLGNLANWQVSVNGSPKPGYRIAVSPDGKISVVVPGLMIIVR